MRVVSNVSRVFWLVLLMLVLAYPVSARTYDDHAALQDLKLAKAVFLLDFTSPRKTAFYLDIIKGTHESLVRQKVEPEFVIVFIGKTVEFLTTEPADQIDMEYADELANIAATAETLNRLGVRMEVCAVATDVFGVDNETVLPSMHVVGDGFISLIGWQSQGYKLVPVF